MTYVQAMRDQLQRAYNEKLTTNYGMEFCSQ